MRLPFQRRTHHRSYRRQKNRGYSLPEVMIGSVILASTVTMTAQLSNSTLDGMQRMDQRARLDSAMAARMEDIRDAAFRHLCIQGCENDELTQQLKYNLTTLRPLCETTELGNSLETALTASNLGTGIFNLTDYDPTAESTPISSTVTASGNQVNVTLSESNTGLSVTTSVVPHAQGWCR
jgi:type II secretory pathway pseudopilin PulG